jgi:hypothetical protein
MTFEIPQQINFESDSKKSKPSLKNTSSSVMISFKDWENWFIEDLLSYMILADQLSDEYDFDPNDDKFSGKCLKVIVNTIRSCLLNEWKSVNNSQHRNDGCIKITFKQFETIKSNLIKSLISETDQLKKSNEKYAVPYMNFFIKTIKAYFRSWWCTFRHFHE